MRKAVILDGNPFVHTYYAKSSRQLIEETGGNTGNLAFRFAVVSHVRNHVHLPWSTPVERIRSAGDLVVLPLANQLGRHTDLGRQADKLEAVGLPVVGIGLGAQAKDMDATIELSEGTQRWLQVIASQSPSGAANIGVRGAFTKTQIERFCTMPAATVTGCPSNFLNLDFDVGKAVEDGFRRRFDCIAVTAGISHIPQLAGIEQQLAGIVTETQSAYIVQHDLEMLHLARGEFAALTPEQFGRNKDYIQPRATDDEFKAWCRRYAIGLYDIRAWMEYLRRFDFVTGTRFHGVMLALQAGVPAGCIAHDSRTFEMCTTMGVPVCHVSQIDQPLTKDNVRSYFSFDADKYREIRQQLASRYLGMLDAAELDAEPRLRALAG
ncbi:polysaccharide pyruvyl transferase family protein [Roseicella aquatilis]|nr:polysaccharide pyruvyl transferase family protein [Roseicella aquatilis]